jgi:hypothetical protein
MIYIVIFIIGVLLFCPLLGLLAHKVPERFHLKIRLLLGLLGLITFFVPFLEGRTSFFIGLGLVMAGVLFMPLKKQIQLLLDVLPIP